MSYTVVIIFHDKGNRHQALRIVDGRPRHLRTVPPEEGRASETRAPMRGACGPGEVVEMWPSSSRRRILRCGIFRRGHDVHRIPIIRLAGRYASSPVDGIDAPGGDVVRLSIAGRQHRLHNHAPADVVAAWETRTGTAMWTPGASLLQIPRPGGVAYFSFSWESPGPCSDARTEQKRTDAQFQVLVDATTADERAGGRPRPSISSLSTSHVTTVMLRDEVAGYRVRSGWPQPRFATAASTSSGSARTV